MDPATVVVSQCIDQRRHLEEFVWKDSMEKEKIEVEKK